VWQACEEGSYSHEETAHSNEPGPVQLRPKMADHSQEQQVTCKKPQHYSSQESQIINIFFSTKNGISVWILDCNNKASNKTMLGV
jgi:hypothetical protein